MEDLDKVLVRLTWLATSLTRLVFGVAVLVLVIRHA